MLKDYRYYIICSLKELGKGEQNILLAITLKDGNGTISDKKKLL